MEPLKKGDIIQLFNALDLDGLFVIHVIIIAKVFREVDVCMVLAFDSYCSEAKKNVPFTLENDILSLLFSLEEHTDALSP